MTYAATAAEHELRVGDVVLFSITPLVRKTNLVPVIYAQISGSGVAGSVNGPVTIDSSSDLVRPYVVREVNPTVLDGAELGSDGLALVVARGCSCGHEYGSHSDLDGSRGACTCSGFSYGPISGGLASITAAVTEATGQARKAAEQTYVWALRENDFVSTRLFLAGSIGLAKEQADHSLGTGEEVAWREATRVEPLFTRTLADGTSQRITRIEVHRTAPGWTD